MRIAVLGSNSHIAKGLIVNFLKSSRCSLRLFTRSPSKTYEFLKDMDIFKVKRCNIEEGYGKFNDYRYDVIINCVGAGTPNVLGDNYHDWFLLTEKYDNMVIEYLLKHPAATYIAFSSGAVYERGLTAPAEENTINKIRVNHLKTEDYYSIARLNSEAKHRVFRKLRIIDLRIFSYFSSYIDLKSGYFITELMNSILDDNIFKTSYEDIIRDYIHPTDLFTLVERCIKTENMNSSYDAYSVKPVRKTEILDYFSSNYGLKYKITKVIKGTSPNGQANIYCSAYKKASNLGYEPVFTSIETIIQESKSILKRGN